MMNTMKFAAHWALYPRSYTVQRVPAGVNLLEEIDGDLTKAVWSNAPWSEPFGDIQGKDCPSSHPQPALTQFKALYDDNHLYIGALVHPSPDVPATEAHFVHRNDPIFQEDSDFEVFIDIPGCNHQYKELEINAIDTVWNLLLDKPYMDGGLEHSGRIAKPGDPLYYDVQHQKTAIRVLEGTVNDPEHGQALWSVELALAYKDLYVTMPRKSGQEYERASASSQRQPSPGDFWRINFSRVEKRGDINWTWQPQMVWKPDAHDYLGEINMHAPEAWGYFHFADRDGKSEPDRDPSWPLRVAAMQIYYAQRTFRKENNRYATTTKELKTLADPSIQEPFGIHFFVNDNRYKVLVTSKHDSKIAMISEDRHLIVQDWDPQLVHLF